MNPSDEGPALRDTTATPVVNWTAGGIELAFSSLSGVLRTLRGAGWSESVAGWGAPVASVDARLRWEGVDVWLSGLHQRLYVDHLASDDLLSILIDLGPLRLDDRYQVMGNLIARRMTVENQGDLELQLTAIRFCLPGVLIGDPADCLFEAPATAVRPRIPMALAAQEDLDIGPSDDFAPAARARWGMALEDAPDATPGLLALHNPVLQQTLMLWYHSDVEEAGPRVAGNGPGLDLWHDSHLAGWLKPGATLEGGTQYILLHEGDWASALAAYRAYYHIAGVLPTRYGDPPDWVQEAVIYEVHPGQFGGFRGLADAVPSLAAMGVTVLYLMPIWCYDNRSGRAWDENWKASGSPYAIRDFEQLEPTLGSGDDFRYLVEKAHACRLRVLLDLVAQGCAIDARYVREHPEWFCRDEAGSLVSSHGWNDTYSFDWANPEYQEYMLRWSLDLMRRYGFDGFRVDAPHGKEPNWDQTISYHASHTNLGITSFLDRLQDGVKAVSPDAALMCELFGPLFVHNHDLACDYIVVSQAYQLLSGRLSAAAFSRWLDDYWAVMPGDAVRVAFTETHDTRGFHPPAYALRGARGEQALLGALVLAGFVPMIWSGQERGQEEFLRRLFAARNTSPAILRGERLFNVIRCQNEWMFSVVRRYRDELAWGLVNFWPEKCSHRFDVPLDILAPEVTYCLHDLIAGRDWEEDGKTTWIGSELESIVLTPEPFLPYFFRLAPAQG